MMQADCQRIDGHRSSEVEGSGRDGSLCPLRVISGSTPAPTMPALGRKADMEIGILNVRELTKRAFRLVAFEGRNFTKADPRYPGPIRRSAMQSAFGSLVQTGHGKRARHV